MKTIIITGASTGIGKSIAHLFIEKEWNVVMNSVNEQNLLKTFREFGSPSNAIAIAGDVGDRNVGRKLVEAALKNFGRLDVLVNNAGIFQPKPFLEVQESDLDQFLHTNLKGTFFTTQEAIGIMAEQGHGAVINIGTVLVDHAIGGFPATAPIASKGGIHALTRQLAAEFGKNNIRVNTIAPGIIRSPLQGKNGIANADSLGGLHLLGRIGEVEDVAQTAYFLANNSFITGETINVDGGHAAGHHFA